MGQKVNPRGFRIGLNDLWYTEGQCYGKSFKNQKHLSKETKITSEFFKQFFESKMLIQGRIEQKSFSKNKYYSIQYVPALPKIHDNIHKITSKVSRIFEKPIEVKKYNAILWYQNGPLLCEFIKLSLKKGIAFRKILNTIQCLLESSTPHQIVLKTSTGIKLLEYTGLKVRYAGRFGGSRSRMASSMVYRIGAVSLQKIETHIEFSESPLYTKQGICNLQIWMAYKIILK